MPILSFFCFMLEALNELDHILTLWINSKHWPAMDPVMYFLSEKWVWLPLYGFLIFLLIRSFPPKKVFLRLLGLGIGVALSDQTTSTFLKPWIQRLRPCHDPIMLAQLYIPHGCGGQFGFASSHAANSFFLAFLFFFMVGKQKSYLKLLLVWAFAISWSRIYLGAHFLGDVFAGGIIGLFWAALVWLLIKRMERPQFQD